MLVKAVITIQYTSECHPKVQVHEGLVQSLVQLEEGRNLERWDLARDLLVTEHTLEVKSIFSYFS